MGHKIGIYKLRKTEYATFHAVLIHTNLFKKYVKLGFCSKLLYVKTYEKKSDSNKESG